jgi:hypothetical protein
MRRILLTGAIAAVWAVVLTTPASATLPVVNYEATGRAGADGWFIGPVTVRWIIENATESIGCDVKTLRSDTAGTHLECTAVNDEGPTIGRTRELRIDQTPPAGVVASASRPPDEGRFYTSPVDLAWSATDALSGLAGCTSLTYAGPDGPAAPAGTCSDVAGNASAAVPFSLSFDTTAPAAPALEVVPGDRVATLRWRTSPDVARITIFRTPDDAPALREVLRDGAPDGTELVDRGLGEGVRYTWTVIARDAAGHATFVRRSATTKAVVVRARWRRPPTVLAIAPPVLGWRKVRGARYYNVQIFRGGKKVMSRWPARARLRLHRRWRFDGKRRRLARGTYAWYVWPGYGPRAQRRYGKLLVRGRFRVR